MGAAAEPLRVAVVGCGIGGPAAALFLARAGHDVTIFEKAPQLGPAGAGILLAPTGQYVLQRLGLLDQTIRHGSRIQRLIGHTAGGRKVLDLRYRNLGTGLFGLGIHRGALFQILNTVLTEQAVTVRSGLAIDGIDERWLLAGEHRFGPYDLVIVADGAHSHLRKSLGFERSARPYDYGALWVSVENWGEVPDNLLAQTYDGTRRMAGILPSGCLPGQGGRLISLFWSIKLSEVERWKETGLKAWKEDVASMMPGLASVLDQIVSPEQVTVASYFDVRTTGDVRDNVVFLGDASHASSPQLGQGASMALFDAWMLANCVSVEPNITAALLNYDRIRRRHIRFYQTASKWMTPVYQSDLTWLAPARDLISPLLCMVPMVQREMVSSMCGFKTGVFTTLPQRHLVNTMASKMAFRSLEKLPERVA